MEAFSALLAIFAGNSPAPGEFPTQRPVTRSFDVYFDLLPNKRLSKQSWGWWFGMPSRPLWRHGNNVWIFCSRRSCFLANETWWKYFISTHQIRSSCATTETRLYMELFKCYQELAFIISDGITAAINVIVHYAIWFVVPAMLMCRSWFVISSSYASYILYYLPSTCTNYIHPITMGLYSYVVLINCWIWLLFSAFENVYTKRSKQFWTK